MSDNFDWDKEHDDSIGRIVINSDDNETNFEDEEEPRAEEAAVTAFDHPEEKEEQAPEKPVFSHGPHTLLGADVGRSRVVNNGPEVAYINARFGISGDEFTEATTAAVVEYQRSRGYKPQNRVSRLLYSEL